MTKIEAPPPRRDVPSSAPGAQQPAASSLPDALRWTICMGAYGAIALASLVPKDMRPTTGVVSGAAEHFFAYLVLGLIAGAALRGRISRLRLGLFTAAYAGVLEAGQFAVPGRVPAVLDFAASALGGVTGLVLLVLILRLLR